MPERSRHALRVVRALVQAVAENAGEHRITQVAGSIAYALLVTLAPVVLAYALLQSALKQWLALPEADVIGASAAFTGLDLPSASGLTPAWLAGIGPWAAGALTLFGATAVFSQYVHAIALIWGVPGDRGPIRIWFRRRFLGLLLLAASALLLAVASVLGSLVSSVATRIERVLERANLEALPIESLLNARFVLGFVGLFVLFTVSMLVIPLERPRFRDIWPGVVATASAYVIGDMALGAYLSSSSRFEAFGAFGALLGSLVWVYYSVLIVLYGAELTREIERMQRALRRTAVESPASAE